MPGFIGFPEILLLGLVVLLIFGPKRLPEMGRSMGRGFREFRDSVTGDQKDEHDRFAVPAAESEVVLLAPAEEPATRAPCHPTVATVAAEPALSRLEREHEKVA
jgi:sec-independent protein translocase protein TatA